MVVEVPWERWAAFATFFGLSLPLVVQDHNDQAVELKFLFLPAMGAIAVVAWCFPLDLSGHLLGASGMVLLGGLLLRLYPDGLGEADVVYAAGFAFLFPFFSVIAALAWACVAGFLVFAHGWVRRSEALLPIPFIPCLLCGALVEFLVGGYWL